MSDARHSKQTAADGIHGMVALSYANEAARLAATGFTAEDLYKVAIELDDKELWLLTGYSPITWKYFGTGASSEANKVSVSCRKASSGTINPGQAVRIADWDETNDFALVELAQSSSPTTMPAVGIVDAQCTDTATGSLMIVGVLRDVDTNGMSTSAPIYVSSTVAGAFTTTPPPGPNIVQALGVVAHPDASEGVIGVNVLSYRAIDYVSDPQDLGTAAAGTSNLASASDHVHPVPKLDDLSTPDDNTDLNATASYHGLLPKLENSGSKYLRDDGTWQPALTGYDNTITVAKSGGDYTTISAALAAITDASPVNKYVVIVYPGTYTENVTMKDWVFVYGVNSSGCALYATSGTAVTFNGSGLSGIYNMAIYAVYGTVTANTNALEVGGGVFSFADCYISISSTGGDYTVKGLEHNGGVCLIRNSQLNYSRAGGTLGLTQYVFDTDFAGFSMVQSRVNATQTSGNDTLVVAKFSSNASGVIFDLNEFDLDNQSGDAWAFDVSVNGITIYGSLIEVIASGDAYIGKISGSSITFVTSRNTMKATATGNAYSMSVASTCAWSSDLDVITASEGETGAGTSTAVHVESNNLHITNDITDGTNSLSVAEIQDAYDHTSDSAPHSGHAIVAHASTHGPGGTAALKLDDLDSPEDNTDLNASVSTHGLLPKLGGGTTNFLRADGSWAAPPGGGESNTASNVGTAGVGVFKQKSGVDLQFKKVNAGSSKVTVTDDTGNDEVDIDVSEGNIKLDDLGTPDDNTDLNASTSYHGLLPKLSGSVAEYLRGDGAWDEPSELAQDYFAAIVAYEHFVSRSSFEYDQVYTAWAGGGSIGNAPDGGHIGVIRLNHGSGAEDTGRGIYRPGTSIKVGGSNPIIYDTYIQFKWWDGARTKLMVHGIGDNFSGASEPSNGVYFRFGASDTYVSLVCANSGTRTVVASDLAPSNDTWYHLKWVISTPGTTPSVQFYINNVAKGSPITTNVPTGDLAIGIKIVAADQAASAAIDVDYYRLIQSSDVSWTETPDTHGSTHHSGGSDPVKLDDLASPDDNTDLNATTSAHGLLPKLGGGTTNYLRADGSWSDPLGTGVDEKFTDVYIRAQDLDFPLNADWSVDDIASQAVDTNNGALIVRRFDDTVPEGVGFIIEIPEGESDDPTTLALSIRARAESAPGASAAVRAELYYREIKDNLAVEGWSSQELATIDIPNNENWQTDTFNLTLTSLGASPGNVIQFELVRDTTHGLDTLSGDWTLLWVFGKWVV